MEALEEDVVDFGGEEVEEEGEEGMEDLNCRHLFLNKLMPSMVRTRSFSTINVSIKRLIHRYYEGSGGKRDMTRKEKRKVARDDRKGPAQTQKTRRRQPPSDEDEEQEEGEAEQPPLKKSKPSKDQPASSSGKSNSEKKEKKKKLPELTLPEESVGGDLEDREIEWLEYMLRKEKGKSKDEDDLDDGLDGKCSRCSLDKL